MSYSCLEELQVDLDLHTLDKTSVLSKAGRKHNNKWFVVTDDGICHLFDKDGNLDDIKKIKYLKEKHIRKDIKKIVIPDSVVHIENWAFSNCSRLMSVMIPDSVTSVGKGVFYDCRDLTSVMIPDSVTYIGEGAFHGCSGLTSVTLPDSVKSIKNYTFFYCSGLISITIPDSVTRIGYAAFYDCNSLINLTFENKIFAQLKTLKDYPWAIVDKSIIRFK